MITEDTGNYFVEVPIGHACRRSLIAPQGMRKVHSKLTSRPLLGRSPRWYIIDPKADRSLVTFAARVSVNRVQTKCFNL